MSKYIKLEDAINLFGRSGEYHADTIADMLSDLPTIEVSEDCISREYMKSLGYINKGDFNSVETIREWIDNAPSVVPTTEQSSEVDIVHCRDCKWWTKQSHSIQGRCELGGILYPTGEWFCANGERIEE